MNISQYLEEAKIVLDLKAKDKEEAIKNLAEVFKDDKGIKDFKSFLDDVFERENLGTTGIGLGIALPHARSESVDSFVIGIGRVKDGVNFGSLDGEPVKLIFLMGTPKEKVQSYLKLLAHLTRLLKRESVRTPLFQAKTASEIIEIFKKEESFSNA